MLENSILVVFSGPCLTSFVSFQPTGRMIIVWLIWTVEISCDWRDEMNIEVYCYHVHNQLKPTHSAGNERLKIVAHVFWRLLWVIFCWLLIHFNRLLIIDESVGTDHYVDWLLSLLQIEKNSCQPKLSSCWC